MPTDIHNKSLSDRQAWNIFSPVGWVQLVEGDPSKTRAFFRAAFWSFVKDALPARQSIITFRATSFPVHVGISYVLMSRLRSRECGSYTQAQIYIDLLIQLSEQMDGHPQCCTSQVQRLQAAMEECVNHEPSKRTCNHEAHYGKFVSAICPPRASQRSFMFLHLPKSIKGQIYDYLLPKRVEALYVDDLPRHWSREHQTKYRRCHRSDHDEDLDYAVSIERGAYGPNGARGVYLQIARTCRTIYSETSARLYPETIYFDGSPESALAYLHDHCSSSRREIDLPRHPISTIYLKYNTDDEERPSASGWRHLLNVLSHEHTSWRCCIS